MLIQHLKAFFQVFLAVNANNNLYIAYSGGLDSTVLLFALSQLSDLFKPTAMTAIHIHHGLSPHADRWEQHCYHFCQELAMPLQVKKIKPDEQLKKQGLEASLRTQRYALFKKILQERDLICTAHHRDDQAETLLLQLFRGAGVKGLAAMPVVKQFGHGKLLRPLLDISRQELLNFAQAHRLSWIHDESNDNTRFQRNFIRQEVMPLIKKRWPRIEYVLARTTTHFAQTQALLDKVAWKNCLQCAGSQVNTLSITKLLALEKSNRTNLIRFWIHQLQFPLPSHTKLIQIEQEVLLARMDANPVVNWQSVEVRRYRDDLYIFAALEIHLSSLVIDWDGKADLVLPYNLGTVSVNLLKNITVTANQRLTIRFRQGGEILYVQNRGHRALKKLMQEWGIPPWQRNRIPLIFVGEQLTQIGTDLFFRCKQ